MKEGDTVTVQFQLETVRMQIERGGKHMQTEFSVAEEMQFKQRRIEFQIKNKNDSILIH